MKVKAKIEDKSRDIALRIDDMARCVELVVMIGSVRLVLKWTEDLKLENDLSKKSEELLVKHRLQFLSRSGIRDRLSRARPLETDKCSIHFAEEDQKKSHT